MPATETPKRGFDGLRLVALLKFGKASLLLAMLYGAYRLLDPATEALLTQWSEAVTDHFLRHLLLKSLAFVEGLGTSAIHSAEAITASYVLLVVVEGIGLWLHRRWAEWLTVIATSALIPFELWKLLFRPNGKALILLGVLVMNTAIVIYLCVYLRRSRNRPAPA
jgi:uncharacterized membrane protein (DUF2068 family)